MDVRLPRFLLAIVMTLLLPGAGQAASPLAPPLGEMLKERNRTADVTVLNKLPRGKVEVEVNEYLFQDDEARLVINVDREVYADIEVGQDYLLVFTRMRKNKLIRDVWEVNPKGPALAPIKSLSKPPIYKKTPELYTLMTPPQKRSEPLSEDAETAMLLAVAENSDDARARELAILEMYLRFDLHEAISIDNAERFAVLTTGADFRDRTYLLRTAIRFPEERRAGWIEREWRRAAMDAEPELDLNSFEPLLVKIAMQGLRDQGDEEDIDLISKHLYANNPGVAKAALEALDAINPAAALARVQQVMSKAQDMHMSTRQAYTLYIEQHAGS